MARPSRLTQEIVRRYLNEGVWQPVTLSDCWDRNATRYSHGVAVTDGRERLTWSEAKIWTDRLALALVQLELERDEVLVVQLPNSIESPLIRVACEKAGILCLPVARTLRRIEMSYCLGFSGAKAVIVPPKYRDFDYYAMARALQRDIPSLRHILVQGADVPAGALALAELTGASAERQTSFAALQNRRYRAEEVSLINSTTGSTGLPKFAEYTAAARLLYGQAYVETLGVTREDVFAALSPAAGGPNIPVYFAAPQTGSKTVFLSHFEPEAAFEIIQQERVTVACLVPAQLAIMLGYAVSDRYDLSSVRFWLSVGAPLAPNLAREAEATLGGMVLNTYGAVDWGGVVFTSPQDPPEVRYSTVGKPRAGTEVRLMDEQGRIVPPGSGEAGELQGRGPSCSTGYYHNPEATEKSWTPDGWLVLGDLGRWDNRGNLTVFGRKDELIIRGAQNIQPGEIEDHLLAHPKVKQVAVVGMPDAIMGQRVCAYVVTETKDELRLEEIVSFLRSRQLAPYKLPERLEVVHKLPMISDTKVNKKLLAADITEKLRKSL
jgi:non-ribosomal peptide synthetase component E (peptide arylation enzyme)